MPGGDVFGIGMSEMLIILAVALLVFGPNKLPEIAKSIAKGMRELRRAGDDLRASVDLDLDDNRPRRTPRAAPPAGATPVVAATAGIPDPEPSPHEPSPHEDAAHIPGSELAGSGTAEVWPRPAEGTLARGGLDSAGAEPAEGATPAPDATTKVG